MFFDFVVCVSTFHNGIILLMLPFNKIVALKYLGGGTNVLQTVLQNDRASIVGDAIEYIDELNRTVKELKILVEQKRHGNNRRKVLKLDQEAAADGESSSMRPVRDDQDNQLHGAIRSSWVQRRSKECHVDVRIVDDEVNIKLTEKKANSLLHAAKVLDEFQLELIHVVGGIIGDHHIFMFNTKVSTLPFI
ncbi:hypothetical protein E2562_014850 [Oryza meyeriana var. granulata]|uniref:BHLH domain-containing protein n=1 Tax=Oryza meyeriana var. granulata TaxID=110450 RepID=A0A6G1BW93_9ORYZ|nr:hypothetical protein E2562_014850 [Oryza meyeriana var. granulata]